MAIQRYLMRWPCDWGGCKQHLGSSPWALSLINGSESQGHEVWQQKKTSTSPLIHHWFTIDSPLCFLRKKCQKSQPPTSRPSCEGLENAWRERAAPHTWRCGYTILGSPWSNMIISDYLMAIIWSMDEYGMVSMVSTWLWEFLCPVDLQNVKLRDARDARDACAAPCWVDPPHRSHAVRSSPGHAVARSQRCLNWGCFVVVTMVVIMVKKMWLWWLLLVVVLVLVMMVITIMIIGFPTLLTISVQL